MTIPRWITRKTPLRRFAFFLLCDSALIIFSLYTAFLLRFDYQIDSIYQQMFIRVLPYFIGVKLSVFLYSRLYQMSWRYVSVKDSYTIIKAVFISSGILALCIYFFRLPALAGLPRGTMIIDALMTLSTLSFLRISKRMGVEFVRSTQKNKGKKTLIIGAGNTGEMILRDIQKGGMPLYHPRAFLDDDATLVGTSVHGVSVAGTLDQYDRVLREYGIEAVIIAIPALGHQRLKALYTTARNVGVGEIKIVPRLYDVNRPTVRVKELTEITIEDLIGRQIVDVDYQEIRSELTDKIILVTGAAGSIGSEIVHQVCRFHPQRVVLFEIDETELFQLEHSLRREFPELIGHIEYVIGDVRDSNRVTHVFEKYRPTIVFHAAAYKHVPMMEYNPTEAVKVNIFGTYTVASISARVGVERFVMISTDKAVRPSSIMGATKRFAEMICHALNAGGATQYLSVRFGNVFGSRGSVLPLFLDQIKRGGPITITHEEMRRYFMTIPEAVSLVLQASVIGAGGDIMLLDMGDPVKIIDLAHELLRLNGLVPNKDIAIELTGMRPGEKLFEKMLSSEEEAVATRHKQVFIAKQSEEFSIAQAEQALSRFQALLQNPHAEAVAVKNLLEEYMEWYQPELNTTLSEDSVLSRDRANSLPIPIQTLARN